MGDQSELVAELVAALEVTSGALAISARGGDTIAFTGPWARLGKLTVNQILDRADAALAGAALSKSGLSPDPVNPHAKEA